MSCIHYKFKSSLEYNSVTFDGLHLSLGDLKKAISAQKRLKQGEFELEITNAQTGDVYKKADELIAKNTSVIVSRVPVIKTNASSTQKSWEAFKQECAKAREQKELERQKLLEKQKQAQETTAVPASEIDKIKAVIDQSTKGFEPSSFQGRHPAAIPPDQYVCKRCGKKGHFIANCPNIKQEDRVIEPRVKRTTGIPSTMLTIVDDPLHPGALLTQNGQFAVPTVDVEGYKDVKRDPPPFSAGENKAFEAEKKIIPKELLCHICEDLCVDAAIAPCCGTSFCDECLREELLESEDHQCPSCHETDVSPDRIVANRSMRIAVTNFLNDTGYTKVKRRRSNSTSGDAGSIFPSRPPSPPPIDTTSAATVSTIETSSVASTGSVSDTKVTPASEAYSDGNESSFQQSGDEFKPKTYISRDVFSNQGRHYTDRSGPRFSSRPHWNSQSIRSTRPPYVSTASSNAIASQAMSGGLPIPPVNVPPHLAPQAYPGVPRYPDPYIAPGLAPPPHGYPQAQLGQSLGNISGYPNFDKNQNAQATSPAKKKQVDVFDSFPDFTKKRSRTPETLTSRSRSRSGSKPRRSSQSYSPAKKESHGRSPRRSFSRSRSRSRTRSFRRSRSGGKSPHLSSSGSLRSKRSRSKSITKHRRGSAESRGLSELRSITPELRSKHSKSRSISPLTSSRRRTSRSPRQLHPRSRSRSGSYKRTYRSRSRSWSRSKKARSRSYSPISRRSLSPRRSPNRSPRRSPRRSPLRSRSPRRSPWRSPKKSPLYSPLRSRRALTPLRRSQSFSPRKRSRSKSRSPFAKKRSIYSRSRSPPRKRSLSPLKSRRSVSPYKSIKRRSPSPYQHRGNGGYRERGRDKYAKDDRGMHPKHSPPRYTGSGNVMPPQIQPPAYPAPAPNLPPIPLLPNMALPPPEEYFKHNPAGYEEFLRTFYAQIGNQAPWGAQTNNPPGPMGNPYPNMQAAQAPPQGFPHDRRPQWQAQQTSPSRKPRSNSPIGRPTPHSPKYGDRYRRDLGRPGFDRGRDRKFDNQRFDDRNRRGDHREEDKKYNDRRWRGDHRDRKGDEKEKRVDSKDRKTVSSEVRDRRGRHIDKHRDTEKTKHYEKSKDAGKTTERTSLEKKRSPERKKSPVHGSRQSDKAKKVDEKKKKEENVDNKVKSDKQSEKDDVAEPTSGDTSVPDTESNPPQENITEAKKENAPDSTDQIDSVQETVEKEKKGPVKKKVGLAGKKLKAKSGNVPVGEKKEKKVKKKKLTFGASEADKGIKKKKLKRVMDYKSENNMSEDPDQDKNNLSDASPLKKAKIEANSNEDGVNETKPPVVGEVEDKENLLNVSQTPDKQRGDEKDVDPVSPEHKKDEVVTELPELSKWERDDFDIPDLEKPEEKPKEKPTLPRSVVDKAEKFLVEKPMKNSVIAASVTEMEDSTEELSKVKEVVEKHKNVPDKARDVSQKHNKDMNRSKEKDGSEKRDDRYRDMSEKRRHSQEERREDLNRYKDMSDKRREYKDYRSKSPIRTNRDNSNKSRNSRDYRSKSPIRTKDYRSKSPIHGKDHRSKSPIHNKTHQQKSPNYNKDYHPKSPTHRSRKVFVESKKDSYEGKGYDIQITVEGDRHKKNSTQRSQQYQEKDNFSEDERSVVKSRSVERQIKSRGHDKEKSDGKRKVHPGEKRPIEKDTTSKSKRRKSEDLPQENNSGNTEKPRKGTDDGSHIHKSPRDLRHKLEEKTKSQKAHNSISSSSGNPRKLSVMDESEFVPDYEDLGPETTNADKQDNSHDRMPSPESKENKDKEKSEEKSDEEGVEGKADDSDEAKETTVAVKHKKSKKKHKHKEKKEKKEKHKHKKKKHKQKNKEKDDE